AEDAEKRGRIREEYRKRITAETESILEQARKALREEGIAAKTISKIGSPGDVILRLAADYDVTVVGASGRYDNPNLGLGPVASRAVEHAPGTILVARELAGTTNLRILLAVDGSLASQNALRSMIAQFQMDSAEITLMHVVETPWIHLGLDREWFDYPEDVFDRADPEIQLEHELRAEAEEVIEEARAELADYNYSVMSVIEEGNPATEILGEAERGEYDLIVLGATGARDAKHNVLGSVSTRVARQATCSVAIVKQD
ncbi:MAG: universal stress protein, partial [Blastocatellia bacterium]|nr:universal stress protein [Blastocatellia bacterium]